MILDWFNADEAVSYAQELARSINKLFPPAEHKGKAIPKKVFQKKFESLITQARTFGTKHRLNIYKKAKLLNTVKWELREAGHEDAFAEDVIKLIAPLLNG